MEVYRVNNNLTCLANLLLRNEEKSIVEEISYAVTVEENL